MKKTLIIIIILIIAVVIINLISLSPKMSPLSSKKGVLINEIPGDMDIIFSSIRYVLHDPACLDENNRLKKNFVADTDCNNLFYSSKTDEIISPRQLYLLDIESRDVEQVTNMNCFFVNGQLLMTKL